MKIKSKKLESSKDFNLQEEIFKSNEDIELYDFISELEKRFNIIDYIKSFAEVKDGWTTCPLHPGTSPNMIVERKEDYNFFICCICKSYGGLINLQMLQLNQSLYEVIERLAKEANIKIPESIKKDIEIYKSRKI